MATLQAALQVAEEWSLPVFPCGADKKPLTTHGFKDASRNIEQIAEWWEKWPGALIGYPTGEPSGLLVLDIDPDGLAWYQQHFDKLAPGVVQQTRRGFHALYRCPRDHDIRCSAGQIARGVDLRCNGGYAILWSAEGLPMTGELGDVTTVPPALLEKLIRPVVAPAASAGSLLRIPNGARNASLARIAGRLRREGASAEEMRAALVAFNGRCEPPLPPAEVEKIAASIARYPAPKTEAAALTYVKMVDITPPLSDSYVVKGLLARDSVAAIIGSSGSGKTFLAGDLAVHIARGEPWRGHRVRGGLVVYVALEGLRSASMRFFAMREALKLGNVPLVLTGGPASLRQPESVAAVLALVRAAEQEFSVSCAAIFIDTLSRAMAGGDENGSEDMGALVAGADALRTATAAVVALVHHLGKDEGRGARGHSLLRAAIDTELTVNAQGEVHVVHVTKQRDYPIGGAYAFRLPQVSIGADDDGDPVTTCLLSEEGQLPAVELSGKHQLALDAALREWRRAHPGEDFIPVAEMSRLALGQGINRQRRSEVLEKFIEMGRLTACEGGFRFC